MTESRCASGRAFLWSNGRTSALLSMPFRCANGPYTGNEEPTLNDLLAEPMVRLLMARDRVDEAEVRRLTRVAAKERLACESD